jgi:uncharacterized sulfatase
MGAGGLNNPYWATWVENTWHKPRIYDLVSRYLHRPVEERTTRRKTRTS